MQEATRKLIERELSALRRRSEELKAIVAEAETQLVNAKLEVASVNARIKELETDLEA